MCVSDIDLWPPKSKSLNSWMFCQILRNSLKVLLRYHIQKNGMDDSDNLNT